MEYRYKHILIIGIILLILGAKHIGILLFCIYNMVSSLEHYPTRNSIIQDCKSNIFRDTRPLEPVLNIGNDAVSLQLIHLERAKKANNLMYVNQERDILQRLVRKLSNQPTKRVIILTLNDNNLNENIAKHIKAGVPFVIRGCATDYPCCKEWSVLKLVNTFGNTELPFTDKNRPIYYDKLYNITDTKKEHYIHNAEQLFIKFPHLIDKLCIKKLHKLFFGDAKATNYSRNMFISCRKGTGVAFHCAEDTNLNIQIEGKKKWTFVDPSYTTIFSPLFNECGSYFAAKAGFASHPNKDLCVLYDKVPKLEHTMEPGDVLYNPSFWWHCIENVTEYTLAVSTRWAVKVPCTSVELRRLKRIPRALFHGARMTYELLSSLPISQLFNNNILLNATIHDEHSHKKVKSFWEDGTHCNIKKEENDKFRYMLDMFNSSAMGHK